MATVILPYLERLDVHARRVLKLDDVTIERADNRVETAGVRHDGRVHCSFRVRVYASLTRLRDLLCSSSVASTAHCFVSPYGMIRWISGFLSTFTG